VMMKSRRSTRLLSLGVIGPFRCRPCEDQHAGRMNVPAYYGQQLSTPEPQSLVLTFHVA
jgi:hypothetical protein